MTFAAIPLTTGEFRRAATEESDIAATIAVATAPTPSAVWAEAVHHCMLKEGVSRDEANAAARHAQNTLEELHRIHNLAAKQWGFLADFLAKIDRTVSVARDVRAGQTFKVDA